MVAMENGRVCVKRSGRDAGKACVVTNVIDENFVKVLCIGRKKKRKCNVRHLEPMPQKIEVKENEDATLKALAGMKK